MMEKLTKKEAREILNRIDLPVSSNRTTLLAADTKSTRQSILLDPNHEDREIAAAIEIQRVVRGYQSRCNLLDRIYPGLSVAKAPNSSIFAYSEMDTSPSKSSHSLVCEAPSTFTISAQIERQQMGLDKSTSRAKLEDAHKKWMEDNGEISFEDYCAFIIQSWWHQVSDEQDNLRVPSVRPPTMNEAYISGRSTQLSHIEQSVRARSEGRVPSGRSQTSSRRRGVVMRDDAARIIQKAWRRHVDMQVYHYYRDLISFKFRGDPALLLRCINPREAELLDSGSGTHVKFRLAGRKFPPNIYYKIFTHRPVVDLCASSPKDYTKASVKQLNARQCHNKGQPVLYEGEKDGWYKRWENNGWRLVSDRILKKIDEDAVVYDSAQKKLEFKHSRLLRKKDVERKRKERKIQWMKQMYRKGMLQTKQGTESPVEEAIESSVRAIIDTTDKIGHGTIEEWEVDELLKWTNGLNFDHYVSEWKEFATSAPSDQPAEKPQFFREDQLPVTFSR